MKLSIITINYNDATGLQRTIESVVSQNNSNFEYIVIDGASTDDSVEIIKKYADKITYWISEPDKGIYNAMNKGISHAKGEYLLFLNSGDKLADRIHLQEFINETSSGEDLIYFNLEIVDVANNTSFVKEYPQNPDFKYFMEDTLPHNGTFIKRTLLVNYGGYSEQMKIISDWAFFTDAVCKLNCSYKHISKHFSVFYNDGISSQPENRKLLWDERMQHIEQAYPILLSIYKPWLKNKEELYKVKNSFSVKLLRKIGFLKWLK